MKRVLPCVFLFLFLPFLFLTGCIPGITDHLGTVTSSLEVTGYTGSTDTSVIFTVDQTDGEGHVSRTIPADSSNFAEGRFQELEPGMWDLTAAFMDGDTAVDSHTVAVEVLPGETSSVTITGTYDSGTGGIAFIDSVSISGADTAIEFTNMNAFIVEERRMWDDSAIDPEMWTFATAQGSFGAAIGGSVLFPDGSLLDIATSRSFSYSFEVEDTEMWISRTGGGDETAGTYVISLYDINHTTRSISYSMDLDLNEVSAPDITSPSEGASLAAVPIDLSLDYEGSGQVAYTYIFVIRNNSAPLWHSSGELVGPQSFYSTPNIVAGNFEVVVLFTDASIPLSVLTEIETNADSWNGIISPILEDYDSEIDYIGAARLHLVGT